MPLTSSSFDLTGMEWQPAALRLDLCGGTTILEHYEQKMIIESGKFLMQPALFDSLVVKLILY